MKSLTLPILILSMACFFVPQSQAWHSSGHLATATVAYNELKQNHPDVLAKAESLLKPLSKFFIEPDHEFIAAAEWPDDIKGQKWLNFNPLHFIDYPIVNPDYDGGKIKTSADNATVAFNECRHTLKEAKGDLALIGKSLCIRFLVHIIGDIHQPLHTASQFSKLFPNGDAGGNAFNITFPEKKALKDLHSYWDATAGNYSDSIKVPLSDKDLEKLQAIANTVTTKWTREALKEELKKKNFNDWAAESNKLAFEFAYDSLKLHSGDTLTAQYTERARILIDHQIALGGYRLADALVEMLQGQKTSSSQVNTEDLR